MNEQQKAPLSEQAAPKKSSRFTRKLRLGSVATVTMAVVIAVILLLNVMMDAVETRFPLTVDLTADGTYSLSDNSVALARGIDKEVEIITFRDESYFASSNTGYEELNTILTQYHQTLKQYLLESGGKVTYTFIDLDANPAMASKYEAYDVNSNTILFLCEDRSQSITVDELFSYDINSSTYAYEFTSNVERIVAAKLNLVTATNAKTATILLGHGEDSLMLTTLEDMLTSNGCLVETLDITASATPSAESSILIIPAATSDYTPDEIAKLRKWLDNDGKRGIDLTVFVNARVRLPNLYELLMDQYKIEVCDGIVYETDIANQINNIPYLAYADVQSTDYTVALAGQKILLGEAAPLKLHASEDESSGTYGKVLASYSDTVKLAPLAKVSDSDTALEENDDRLVAADSYPLATAVYVSHRDFDNDADEYITTDVMVFGSPTLVQESYINITSACNEELFMNTFRGLTGLESVISIPSRNMTQQTLDFSGSLIPLVLGLGVFTIGLPLVLIIAAIVVFVVRRRL